MGIVIASGKVTNITESTHTTGRIGQNAVTGTVQGKTTSKQVYSFRIDNRPITFESKNPISISDGDLATCAGPQSGGVIKAMKIRNDSTGVIYGHSPVLVLLGMIGVFIGAAMLTATGVGAILGIPLLFVAAWGFYKTSQLFASTRAVESQGTPSNA
jgi:hypothetical protein